jgi:putative tricarboxylic transport membrane protein
MAGGSKERGSFAPGGIKIRSPRDFWGGIVLIALAGLAFILTGPLGGMSGASFGPGTAPRLFAGLLALFGLVVSITGLFQDGPPMDAYAMRGPAYVIAGIVAFALMMRGFWFVPALGLVPSTFAAFVISIAGSNELRWIEGLIAGAAMTLFCVILFVYLLKLPFELWPSFF